MKDSDFKVGRKYRRTRWADKEHYVTCIGHTTDGIAVFETPEKWLRSRDQYDIVPSSDWVEYREPREFTLAITTDGYTIVTNGDFDAEEWRKSGREIVKVREIIDA